MKITEKNGRKEHTFETSDKFIQFTDYVNIMKKLGYSDDVCIAIIDEAFSVHNVDTEYLVVEDLLTRFLDAKVPNDDVRKILIEMKKYYKTYDTVFPEPTDTKDQPIPSANYSQLYKISVIARVLKNNFSMSNDDIQEIVDNISTISDLDGNKMICQFVDGHTLNDTLQALGYDNTNTLFDAIEETAKKDAVKYELFCIRCRMLKIKWDDIYKVVDSLKEEMEYAPRYAKKVLKNLQEFANRIAEMHAKCGSIFRKNMTLQELLKADKELKNPFGLVDLYTKVMYSINSKDILSYAKEEVADITPQEIAKLEKQKPNIFTNLFPKKDKKVKEKKAKKETKETKKENKKDSKKENTKAEKITTKILKNYESNKLLCLRYDFFKTCDKYSQKDMNNITCLDLLKWKLKNAKCAKKLKKLEHELDAKVAIQKASAIDDLLQSALEYDEKGNITDASYKEYLKLKNMSYEELNNKVMAKMKLSNEESALKSAYEAQEIAKNYANMIKEEKKELEKMQKAKKKRNIIKGTCFGIIAAITIMAAGKFGFVKNTNNNTNPNPKEPTTEMSNELETEMTEETETIVFDIKEETNIPENIENNEEKQEVSKEVLEDAKQTLEMAQKLSAKLSDDQVTDKVDLETAIINLQTALENNSEADIKGSISELLNIENSIVDQKCLAIGTSIDISSNAKVYTNIYNMTNEVNAKNSYYGSNENIGRTVGGVVLEKDGNVVVAKSAEDVYNYDVLGYDLSGYLIGNNYGPYEGWYSANDVNELTLDYTNGK